MCVCVYMHMYNAHVYTICYQLSLDPQALLVDESFIDSPVLVRTRAFTYRYAYRISYHQSISCPSLHWYALAHLCMRNRRT